MMKQGFVILLIVIFLVVAAMRLLGDTNIVSGVRIKSVPVVEVTMASNHVYTLWHTADLERPEWEVLPMFTNFYAKKTYKAQVASSEFGTTGFFWLQIDGDTNFPFYIVNTNSPTPPPIPQ